MDCFECKRDFPWLYEAHHRSGIEPPIVYLCYYCTYQRGLTPVERNKRISKDHDYIDYGNPDTIQCKKCGHFKVPWKETECIGYKN